MISTARRVSDYIAKCASSGITSIEEIYKVLESDISAIEDELQKAEPLRVECRELQKMQAHISTMLRTDKITSVFDDESEYMKSLRKKIVKIMETQAPLSNRDMIMKAGYNKDADVIRCVKCLAEDGIISKDPDTKLLVHGSNWGARNV